MFIHAYASLYTHQASAVYLSSSGKKWTKSWTSGRTTLVGSLVFDARNPVPGMMVRVPGIPCKQP